MIHLVEHSASSLLNQWTDATPTPFLFSQTHTQSVCTNNCLNKQCFSHAQDGETALEIASSSGHTDVVKLLVDYGAQIDNTNNVSTEAYMVLPRYCSFTIYIPPPHAHTKHTLPAS